MRAALALYELLLGAALLLAPWSILWQENWLFWRWAPIESFAMSGPVRGAVSGIGAACFLAALEDGVSEVHAWRMRRAGRDG
jgi:hypothetical protein